ncbi:hypothetical protein [Glacieibacterium frigidum]|uniref:DUF2059 domain-containing protein n=1 Tax=Glacieibacterium frigidum TaxID=2593303 RepID=A0A552U8H3_9SPHN|nr:hypothetical protein [Glacieibacterium frigidum]TRW14518.1 hypothetical protein FMM06_12510 [Glacieibacterium frigidum]
MMLAATVMLPGATAVAPDAAAQVAAAMAPQQQLASFVRRTLDATVTGRMVVDKVGRERADALFAAETARVVEKYGAEWEANLAASYRETLNPAELATAQAAVAARDQAAMMPLMQRVGPVMQAKSTKLLERASLDALNAVVAAAEKPQ